MKKDFILTNIHLVDPTQGIDDKKEIWVEKGKVKEIAGPGEFSQRKLRDATSFPDVIDGQGALCVPGLVDVHVHLREPGAEYKETIKTGTKAAAAGGYTSVVCMANTKPVNDNPYVTHFIQTQAKQHGLVRVYPIGALSKGLKGEELAEIGKMYEAGIVGVSDDGMPVMNSYLMRKALDYCRAFDLPIMSHAEDANLVGKGVMNEGFHSNCLGLRGIPSESEEIIVARDVALARLTGGRVHICHLSTAKALEHVRRAKEEGLKVTCEVTPHHLVFKDEDVQHYNANFKMAPPLRSEKDIEILKQGIKDGIVDCVATDHAPHANRDKDVLFEFAANGVVGLETAWSVGLDLVEQGLINRKQLVELYSKRPANLVNIPGGALKVGMNADFMLSDPGKTVDFTASTIESKSKNSPWIGKSMKGQVLATFVDGELRWSSKHFNSL